MIGAILVLVPTLLLALLIAYIIKFYVYWMKLPPGPLPIPFLGNALMIKPAVFHMQVQDLFKKYGKVFTLMIGPKEYIVVNDLAIVKELFVNRHEDFSERPVEWYANVYWNGQGILGSNWKPQRKFMRHTFRNFGLGKPVMEERVTDAVKTLVQEVHKRENIAYDYKDIVVRTAANFTTSVLFGEVYPYDDNEIGDVLLYIHNVFVTLNPIISSIMWAHKIPGDPFGYGKCLQEKKKLLEFAHKQLDKRQKEFDGENVDTFADAMLLKMKEEPDAFSLEECSELLLGLVFGGVDTSTQTLLWGLFYLALHPEIQQKAREEIWGQIGKEKYVTTKERPLLPYTDAVISEVSRIKNAVPLSLPHLCSRNTTVGEYFFPKDSAVLPNLYGLSHDDRVFAKPEEFYPEHFYDSTKNECLKNEQLAHFSYGRRDCAGQQLAKIELFLFFVALIQRFEWRLPEGAKPDMIGITSGIILKPTPYKVIAKPL